MELSEKEKAIEYAKRITDFMKRIAEKAIKIDGELNPENPSYVCDLHNADTDTLMEAAAMASLAIDRLTCIRTYILQIVEV